MIPVISAIIFIGIMATMMVVAFRMEGKSKDATAPENIEQNNILNNDVPAQQQTNALDFKDSNLLTLGILIIIPGIFLFIWGLAFDITVRDTDIVNMDKITNKIVILISGSTAILIGTIMACAGTIKNHMNKNLDK